MFVCITIFAIPVYYIYKSKGQDTYSDQLSHPISQFMLGNMGGASIFCHQYFMEKNHADIECPAGTVLNGQHVRFGLISTEHEMKNFCH